MNGVLIVDGENLKGKIKSLYKYSGKERPLWHQYDFGGLFQKVLSDIEFEQKIFYFAKIKEHAESRKKSRELIEEQRLLKTHLERQGFLAILSGRVRGQLENDRNGGATLVFKEKGVDVRMAVDMVTMACDGIVNQIVLASSDSDLQPAINEVKKRKVSCIYLGFENQPNKGLVYTTDRSILIRNSEVFEFGG